MIGKMCTVVMIHLDHAREIGVPMSAATAAPLPASTQRPLHALRQQRRRWRARPDRPFPRATSANVRAGEPNDAITLAAAAAWLSIHRLASAVPPARATSRPFSFDRKVWTKGGAGRTFFSYHNRSAPVRYPFRNPLSPLSGRRSPCCCSIRADFQHTPLPLCGRAPACKLGSRSRAL
jgi:hypothetical protein